ncbi:MAG: TonB-dependent receptor, partial [Acidobacteria bacterium]|nr:TonB-dependent receptor [Acidobacteriota bacterium]
PVFPGYSYDYIFRRQNFLWSDSYALSPTWMNEFRFSYSRFAFDSAISDDSVPEAHTLPYLSIPNVSAPGMYTGIRNFQFANKWLFQETQTKLTGRHTLRYGFEFLRQLTKRRPAFNERGMLIYQNSVDPAYSAFANYLDDFSGPAGISAKNFGEPVFYPNQFRQSYFFQDSWKMAPSLTLTFGLRYENFGTPANIFEYPAFAGFDPSKFLEPNRVKPDNDNFGPAFGFAWSPGVKFGLLGKLFGDRRMVWRGGFQVSYDAFFDGMLLNIQSDAPNTVATTVVGSFLWRGTPDFFSTLPTDPRPVTPMDRQTSVLDPNIRSPYTERWSLGFQRQLPRGLAMDLSYVGSASHKLFTKEDLNARQLDGKRPHPDFGIRQIVAGSGNSNYHAMQLRVERRFATTLFLTGSYTWSRTIDSTSDISAGPSMNYEGSALTSVPAGQGGLRLDRALSDYHRSHLLVFVYSWDVPGPVNGFLGYLAGGWTLSGVSTFTSGAPYTARNGFDRNNDGISADRPDIGNPNAPLNTRAVISGGCPTGYLNPDTNVCVTPDDVHFVQGTGFPGSSTVGRNTLFTGGINQTWMNVMKMIPVAEGKKLEFRLEAMNVFNHASYANVPNASVVGSPGPAGGLPSRFLNRDYTLATNRAMNVQLKLVF